MSFFTLLASKLPEQSEQDSPPHSLQEQGQAFIFRARPPRTATNRPRPRSRTRTVTQQQSRTSTIQDLAPQLTEQRETEEKKAHALRFIQFVIDTGAPSLAYRLKNRLHAALGRVAAVESRYLITSVTSFGQGKRIEYDAE